MGGYIGNSVVGVEHPSTSALNATTGAFTGAVTADAGVAVDNITIDGTEIDLSSGDLTIDVAGDIILDAAGAEIKFANGGTVHANHYVSSSNYYIYQPINDKDIIFQGTDNSSTITALTLDMSEAGAATFNAGATFAGTVTTDNIANASSNLLIASTQSMTLRFDSDNDQTNREFNLQRNASTGILKAEETGDITFFADDGSTEALRWDASTSRLGLGRTAPATTLDVAGTLTVTGTASRGLTITSAQTSTGQNDADAVYDAQDTEGGGGGSHIFKVGGNEKVVLFSSGINSSAVAGNGTVSSANLFISSGNNFQKSSSSSRYKTDITESTRGLSDVMKMRSVTYKGINDGDRFFGGLIAEEVHDAGLIEYVDYRQDDDGNDIPEGVHYGHMVALAFKAIQELKTELDAEKAKTTALQTQVADLITRVTSLENA